MFVEQTLKNEFRAVSSWLTCKMTGIYSVLNRVMRKASLGGDIWAEIWMIRKIGQIDKGNGKCKDLGHGMFVQLQKAHVVGSSLDIMERKWQKQMLRALGHGEMRELNEA